jgi:hypothetical protein
VRRPALLLTVLLCVAPAAAAPAPFAKPERRTGLEHLRGEWEVVSEQRRVTIDFGRGASAVLVTLAGRDATVTITGGRFRLHRGATPSSNEAIRAAGPGALDLTDEQAGLTRRAAYARSGDLLVICASVSGATGRPNNLRADGHGETLYTLRRKR